MLSIALKRRPTLEKLVITLILVVVALSGVGVSSAQDQVESVLPQGYLQLLSSDLMKERVRLLTQAMALSGAEATLFWPVYREYEVESDALWDARVLLIAEYASHVNDMTEEKASELAQRAMALEASRMALRQRYFTRLEEELSAIVGARFLQVEGQINLLVDLQISQQTPLIGKTQ